MHVHVCTPVPVLRAHVVYVLLRHRTPGHCLCNGRWHHRRPLPVTAASCNAVTVACNGRPLSVTAADIAAARFL
jgi:hypothetical protein